MHTIIEVFHASEVEENLHEGYWWRLAGDDTHRPSASVGPFDTEQQAEDNAREECIQHPDRLEVVTNALLAEACKAALEYLERLPPAPNCGAHVVTLCNQLRNALSLPLNH